jgi:hypothetical protein
MVDLAARNGRLDDCSAVMALPREIQSDRSATHGTDDNGHRTRPRIEHPERTLDRLRDLAGSPMQSNLGMTRAPACYGRTLAMVLHISRSKTEPSG